MSGTNRKFEFVNYTDGTNKALPKVRKHVMKDYFWRQSNSNNNNARIDKKKDFAVKELTWMQPETIETSKPRKQSTSNFPAALINLDLKRFTASRSCITPSKGGALILNAFVPPVPHGLDAHILDPFDSLPIKNDPDVGSMLQWYFTTSKLRTTTIIPWVRELNGAWQRVMWDLAQADKGALHALLTVAEVKMLALTGDMNTVRYCNNVEKVIDAIKDYLIGKTIL